MEEMTALQEKIDAGDLWDIDSQDRDGDGRAALSARRLAGRQPLGRRAAQDRAGAAAAFQARHAAARRAHQPPRRRERRLAAAPPGELPRLRDPGHPRPLLPRPGDQVDARIRPRKGRPLRGQLLRLAGAEGQAGDPGAVRERGAPARDGQGAGVGALQRPRPAGQVEGPARQLRQDDARGRAGQGRADPRHDPDHARPEARQRGAGGRGAGEGIRRQGSVQGPDRSSCRPTASSA